MTMLRDTLLCILVVVGGAGCSSQQLYGGGHAWQQQECSKLMDAQERNRCMASAKRSYDEYKREADAAKGKS
jgi:hypothetical protein